MAADNTSGFNCRYAVTTGPKQWSVHAYGEAIDVNPVQNPYVFNGVAQPVAGKAYIDRSDVRAGMAEVGGVLNDAFASVGWFWEDDGTHHRTTSTSPRPAVEKVLPLLARSRDRHRHRATLVAVGQRARTPTKRAGVQRRR